MYLSVLSLLLLASSVVAPRLHAAARADSAPPPGLRISEADRAELEKGAAQLGRVIESLRVQTRGTAEERLMPDVIIYHKAVDWALRYNEFLRTNETPLARTLLKQGLERARQLGEGKAPWLSATGLVVRGYLSRIDGSVQPYGLVVPAGFASGDKKKHRLDVWLHGRDNNLTELKFISDRQRSYGEFTPPDTMVLHPYGRYCNAFKFAGETDVFEALEHAKANYPIDEQRLAIRGFSMGGAGCWHIAAHHPAVWAGAAPGAGFAETAIYTKSLSKEPKPPSWEQSLWHLYDATDYAANLFNLPTIAYSGELDKQKQAAEVMAAALQREGLTLEHIIGPKVEHKYEPGAKKELSQRFDEWMARGRVVLPAKIRFTTWTLRYNRAAWFTVDGLERHWQRARVESELSGEKAVSLTTSGVTALTLGPLPESLASPDRIRINGQEITSRPKRGGGAWTASFERQPDGKWSARAGNEDSSLRKRSGLQGPIDDAFTERFLMVRPTGKPLNEALGKWAANELAYATNQWRAQFRGDAMVKDDVAVSDADISSANLILWGDPQSNLLLKRIASKLPLKWDGSSVSVGSSSGSADKLVPVMIFPNPLNPSRYVVLNSGFTFAEFGPDSNAQQTPKLPDYALVDISVPRERRPRQSVVAAGFFDERWAPASGASPQ
jgi:pimeloyl-ACP methyl ester carboxylesterase